MTKLKKPDAKILLLDVEWRPTKTFVWGAFKQYINPVQIIEDGGLLCVGAKWLGEKHCDLFSEWEHGHKEMLNRIHAMISAADAVITYNGDKYDLKKLEGEFLLHGLEPPPTITSIDCLKVVKKFGYFMNRLAFIGPFLGLGKKIEHEGFSLWIKVMDGNEKAQAKMERYCRQDVVLLEKLYLRIRPFIRNHPHLHNNSPHSCPNCGGKHLQKRGFRRTKSFKIQRLQCQTDGCGAWSDGPRAKVA